MRRVGHIRVDLGAVGAAALVVLEHQADAPGPAVAITSAVHGDEATGVFAARRLDALLPERLLRGRVILFPAVNPAGLAASTRVVPQDGVDLNRVFPGARRGAAAERLAAVVWEELQRHRIDALVDLHADSSNSVPYAIADRAVTLGRGKRAAFDAGLFELAAATGLTVLREYPDAQYLRFGLERSLAGAMVNRASVPAVTVECGGRRVADDGAAQVAADAVWGVLAHLGMIDGQPTVHPTRAEGGPWRRASAVYTRSEGLFHPLLAAGEPFAADVPIAEVVALDGEVLETIHSARAGLAVSWNDVAWIRAGTAVGTFATRER